MLGYKTCNLVSFPVVQPRPAVQKASADGPAGGAGAAHHEGAAHPAGYRSAHRGAAREGRGPGNHRGRGELSQ